MRSAAVRPNPALNTREGRFFEPILDDAFYQTFFPFCNKMNIQPTMQTVELCSRIAVFKVRAMQGAVETLNADLAVFNDNFLSRPPHSAWSEEEKLHLFALRQLLQNRNQAALAFQVFGTPRDSTAAENFMRRAHVYD